MRLFVNGSPLEYISNRINDAQFLRSIIIGNYQFILENIVAVFAYLGLRPEEVRGLRWEDVDLEAKRLHIERAVVYHGGVKGPMIQEPKTKGSKTWLPITDALYAILVKHKQESGRLVHEPNGDPIYSDHHWQKYGRVSAHMSIFMG